MSPVSSPVTPEMRSGYEEFEWDQQFSYFVAIGALGLGLILMEIVRQVPALHFTAGSVISISRLILIGRQKNVKEDQSAEEEVL